MKLKRVSGNLFVDEYGHEWIRYSFKDSYRYEMVYHPKLTIRHGNVIV